MSASPAPRSMMRRSAIWYQRSGSRKPISRTPGGMSWYGNIEPESTNDGRMKKTEMNTACAEVCASVETKTPIASDASTNGRVTRSSASQLPRGQMPNTSPASSIASSSTA